jgi:hypothetical protein
MTDQRTSGEQVEVEEPAELAKETLEDLQPDDGGKAGVRGGGFSVGKRNEQV